MKSLNLLTAVFSILLFGQSAMAQHMNHKAIEAQPVENEHSIYHMDATWTNHRDETFQLADLQGQPVVVVMFYGNCTQVCPILIRDARRVFEAVNENLRSNVKVLAVTFDPKNDTPEQLKKYAIKRDLNISQWHFTTGNPADIRELAMLLGVQYSQKSDGHFSHSNLVTVLDSKGRIAHQIEGLNKSVEEAADFINQEIHNQYPIKGS